MGVATKWYEFFGVWWGDGNVLKFNCDDDSQC